MSKIQKDKQKSVSSRIQMSNQNSNLKDSSLLKNKQRFSQQSIKLFKLQIDHEIAKCLNTLDRQGLKYLRQTLKYSNLFESTSMKQTQNQNFSGANNNSQQKVNKKNETRQQITKKNNNTSTNPNKYLSQNIKNVKNQVKNNKNLNRSSSKKIIQTSNSNYRTQKNSQTKIQIQIPQKIHQKAQTYKKQTIHSKNIKAINKPSTNQNKSRVIKKIIVQNKKTNEKISLGQQLNKKMAQYNINKVGPRNKQTNKSSSNNTKQKKNIQKQQQSLQQQIMIEQQIQKSIEDQYEQLIQNNQVSNISNVSKQMIKQIKQYQKKQVSNQYDSKKQQTIKINSKVNPFIMQKKQQSIFIKKQQSIENQKIVYKPKKQSLLSDQKISQSIQVDNIISNDRNKNNKNEDLQLIMSRIYNLSPQKLHKLQKLLQNIDNNQNNESEQQYPLDNIQSNITIQQSQVTNNHSNNGKQQKQKIIEQNWIEQGKQSEVQRNKYSSFYNKKQLSQNNQSQSKTIEGNYIKQNNQSNRYSNQYNSFYIKQRQSFKKKKEKKEKASTIFSNSKSKSRINIKIQNYQSVKDHQNQQKNQQIKQNQQIFIKQNNSILSESKPLKMEKINFNKKINKQKQKQIQKQKQKTQVFTKTSNKNDLQQPKLINLSLKRSISSKKQQKQEQKTEIKFKIISNHGHQNMYGLSKIQLYDIFSQKIIISNQNISQNQSISNIKILKLFNNQQKFDDQNIFLSTLNKNEIILKINKQKICGIRIFNFHKLLQNNKQVKQLQVYHNNIKIWNGQLKRSSYKNYQDEENFTQIQLMSGFKFPRKQSLSMHMNKSLGVFKNSSTNVKQQNNKFNKQLLQQINLSKQQQKYESSQQRIISRRKQNQLKQQSFHHNRFQNIQKQIKNEIKPIQKNKNYPLQKQKNKIQKVKSFSKFNLSNSQSKYDQFDSVLKGFQQNINRNKSKSKLSTVNQNDNQSYYNKNNKQTVASPGVPKKSIQRQLVNSKQLLKNKNITNNNSSDFMNDSLFQDKPKNKIKSSTKRNQIIQNKQQNIIQIKQTQKEQKKNNNKNINIDDFLDELNDVMINKDKSRQKINKHQQKQLLIIPNLPKGQQLSIQIYQNWGHPAYVGFQNVQFFDQNGLKFLPIQVQSNKLLNSSNNSDLLKILINNKNNQHIDNKNQIKLSFDKGKITDLLFKFYSIKNISMIRIWNYNGQRVHNNIGIRYCRLKIKQNHIFQGQLIKNQSNAQNFYKFCTPILFTNDNKIINKIKQNDWLYQIKKKIKQQKKIFKTTLQNFIRPKTKNTQDKQNNINKKMQNKQNQNDMKIIKRQIILPKRQCWEYEPPEMPTGNLISLILHDSWGDNNFIGLNGLQIFDQKGQIVNKSSISKINAYPSNTGQKNDCRIVDNLINGVNNDNSDKNIWLATYQSDLQKMQSGNPNTIIIELSSKTKISGINFYNYSKTPQRGVKQIQIQINNFIVFRGYLRIYESTDNLIHTSINFTKDIKILQKINYYGYNEDNLDQKINFINQKKLIQT